MKKVVTWKIEGNKMGNKMGNKFENEMGITNGNNRQQLCE